MQERLAADIHAAGGEVPPDTESEGAIGTTMFDLPGSEDETVTVLLPQRNAQLAGSQALVRIKSRKGGDGRTYLGMVKAGPFAEPDSLRGDSHMLVTVAARGGIYQPPYHGRLQVSIPGEELANGALCPPRLRPLPNSPVFALSDEESAAVLWFLYETLDTDHGRSSQTLPCMGCARMLPGAGFAVRGLEVLPEDDLVFFLLDLVPQIDLSAFHEHYAGELRGQPPFDVTMMVTLLVYAYCVGVRSSRKIAAACERNLAFRAIVGKTPPDFRTISDFRKIHLAALEKLFVEVLRWAGELGMVKLVSGRPN
jgi:transposase